MLLPADLNTRIYPEIQAAIDRDDEGFAEKAIAFAEGMAKSYLSRFNTSSLFAATGENRDGYLMGILKDIATHEFTKLANIEMDLTLIENNYLKAEKLLEKIQSGKSIPEGWPLKTTPVGADQSWHVGEVDVRETRW